jgi:biopolymer transport protein ExbB
MRYTLLFVLLSFWSSLLAQPFGYSYAKQITIQSAQVSGGADLSNFPVLISFTDANLRTTANSGHVTNSNGYDIIFTTSDCLTILSHQIESYTATTGQYIAWVRVPTVSASANTVIQMYYGNSSVSSNPSVTGVWDSNYKGVWHFNNSVSDYTSNASNLTDNSTSNTTGKIGEGRDLNNSSDVLSNLSGQHLRLANGFFSGVTNFTFEGWINQDRSSTNWERIFDFGQGTVVNFFLCPSTGTGSPAETRARITVNNSANEQGPVSANVTNTGAWIHWAVVLNNATSTMTLYKNGAVLATASGTVTNTPQSLEPSTVNYFGRSQYAADHYIDAQFDEFRISSSARSAGWITTSYNNQNAPSSFYTVSAEAAAVTLCSTLPVELSDFKATPFNNTIELSWTTFTEINNDHFTIERSIDGAIWEKIADIPGAGNSTQKLNYRYVDARPYPGKSYYRLHQIDYDGSNSHSSILTVETNGNNNLSIYHRADLRELVIKWDDANLLRVVSITNVMGQSVTLPSSRTTDEIVYATSGLVTGIYVIHGYYNGHRFFKKIFIE